MTQQSKVDQALEQMHYQRMQPLLNNIFHLSNGVEITLVEAEKTAQKQPALHSWQKPKPQLRENTPFTLVFRFPADHPIQQGIYSITHPTEGVFEGILLVPITQDENGLYFEAVFN